jgi:hypothetical protein
LLCGDSRSWDRHESAHAFAKHDLAVLELQRKLGGDLVSYANPVISGERESELERRLREASIPDVIWGFGPEDEIVPDLSNAPPSDLSMLEFAHVYPMYVAEFKSKFRDLTTAAKPNFLDKYAGKSYCWSGFVSDVQRSGTADNPQYCVYMRLDPDKTTSFTASCVFAGSRYDRDMAALKKDQAVTIRGVSARSRRLVKCEIVADVATNPLSVSERPQLR